MPILGLCQWRTIPIRRPAPTMARRLPVPDKADYGPNNATVDNGYYRKNRKCLAADNAPFSVKGNSAQRRQLLVSRLPDISNNVGPVKLFLSTLVRALRRVVFVVLL